MQMLSYNKIHIRCQFHEADCSGGFEKRVMRRIKGWQFVGGDSVFRAEDDFSTRFDGPGKPFISIRVIQVWSRKNNVEDNRFDAICGESFYQTRV